MEALQEVFVDCPHCGEHISVLVDASVAEQAYIEDCEVCCAPIVFDVRVVEGQLRVQAACDRD
jgi:translation initiation factor 2 beta subunit (eIF-2beta)/eIF-5